jgi:oleate hydratase
VKPEGVDHKSAYLIGSGLAALSAACFLVRDGQMPGNMSIFWKKSPIPGGACDGYEYQDVGYVMRGGREMDNHFECMWDLFRSIPPLRPRASACWTSTTGSTRRPELLSLPRHGKRGRGRPHRQKIRPVRQGRHGDHEAVHDPGRGALQQVASTTFFDDEVLNTNFWLYWRTMFAFENWHSALEMKLYLQRYIHHIGGLPDFTALRFTKYNQYESMILPMANIWRITASSSITTPRSPMCLRLQPRQEAGAKKIDVHAGGGRRPST